MAHEALVSVRSGACLPPSKVHTVIVRRWACPVSSEVLADFVRKRACPSSSEVLMPTLRGGRAVCNPSSSEVHSDVADVLAEVVKKRASVQSLFLRGSRGRRRGRRWTWGVESLSFHPMETHNQRTTDANIPNCATPQSTASNTPTVCDSLHSHETKHRKRNFAPVLTQETKHSMRQENSHLHMLSRPQCACILGDHQTLDGTETSYMMLELLNNWAIPNFHDMRRLSHVFQRMSIRQHRAHLSHFDAFDDMSE